MIHLSTKKGKAKSPEEIHRELRIWDGFVDDESYDEGYVLGFRMALKWALGLEPPMIGASKGG